MKDLISMNNLCESFDTNFNELDIKSKADMAFAIHNTLAALKDYVKIVSEKQEELYKAIAQTMPCKVDEEGKLISTEVMEQETGETIGILEWKQDKKEKLDEEKAIDTLKANNIQIDHYVFYDKKLKTKKDLIALLRQMGLSYEAIDSCFSNIERKEPTLCIKKF